MRYLILLALLSACAPHADLPKSPPVLDRPANPEPIYCNRAVSLLTTNIAPAYDQVLYYLFDGSLDSAVFSGLVPPGETRYIDVDYGCIFEFHEFQFRNNATGIYAFGEISLYTATSAKGPWTYQTTFKSSDSKQIDANNWAWKFTVTAGFVRYVLKNVSGAQQEFVISDIESDSVAVERMYYP